MCSLTTVYVKCTNFFYIVANYAPEKKYRSLHLCRLLYFLITQLPSQLGNCVGNDADDHLCLIGCVILAKAQS